MRLNRFGKIGSLAALAALSYFATSSIMPRFGEAKSTTSAEDNTEKSGTWITDRSDVLTPNAPDVAPPTSIVSGVSKPVDVEVEGRTLHVTGGANVHDYRPNMKYIWAVRVLDSDKPDSLLFEKLYYDRILEVPESGELDEDFVGDLEPPLAAGTYRLELTWYAIHPDSGLAGLSNPVLRELYRAPGATVPITLNQ